MLTPRIIAVFYHQIARTVNDADHITLQVVGVAVLDYVKLHHGLPVLRIVEEVQPVRYAGRMVRMYQLHYILVVEDVLGSLSDDGVYLLDLLRPESGMVVGELHRYGVAAFNFAHTLELPPGLPGVRPCAVVQWVA